MSDDACCAAWAPSTQSDDAESFQQPCFCGGTASLFCSVALTLPQ